MSKTVPNVTTLTAPSKALWKTGLKAIVVTTVTAVAASAIYHGLKKDEESPVETTAA